LEAECDTRDGSGSFFIPGARELLTARKLVAGVPVVDRETNDKYDARANLTPEEWERAKFNARRGQIEIDYLKAPEIIISNVSNQLVESLVRKNCGLIVTNNNESRSPVLNSVSSNVFDHDDDDAAGLLLATRFMMGGKHYLVGLLSGTEFRAARLRPVHAAPTEERFCFDRRTAYASLRGELSISDNWVVKAISKAFLGYSMGEGEMSETFSRLVLGDPEAYMLETDNFAIMGLSASVGKKSWSVCSSDELGSIADMAGKFRSDSQEEYNFEALGARAAQRAAQVLLCVYEGRTSLKNMKKMLPEVAGVENVIPLFPSVSGNELEVIRAHQVFDD
jgi:hypothetical protein